MTIKANEATVNRPEGDRIIDAPFVFIDTENHIRQLLEEDAWQKNDRNAITVFKTAGQTIVLCALHAGAELAHNEVKGIVGIQVSQGLVTISVAGTDTDLRKGEMIVLHKNTPHSLTAKDDSFILITTTLI